MSTTRRRFLAGAAAVAGAPYFMVPSARGAATSPNNRINLAVIGLGTMGGVHLGDFVTFNDVQIVAVCDVEANRREQWRQRVNAAYAEAGRSYKGCAAIHDFRDVLARDDVDAVLIATPEHWHAIMTIEACRAGKDVYCEKPLSHTIREARLMADAARNYGRVVQTGTQQRSSAEFRLAVDLVRTGRIGKVQTIHIGVGGTSREQWLPEQPVPPSLDYNLWLGPAPWKPYHPDRVNNWRDHRDYSGGQMADWGAHHFDVAQWAMGADNSGPTEIYPPDGRDFKTLTYKYANGTLMYHGGANGVKFTGTDGVIEVNRGYLKTWPEEIAKMPILPQDKSLWRAGDHRRNWLECIRTRRLPVTDASIGARSVTVCHLGNLAYWLNRPLKWNPAKEEFEGDDEANRWLDRPMRAPWRL
jgi:predicted dehydrogenase